HVGIQPVLQQSRFLNLIGGTMRGGLIDDACQCAKLLGAGGYGFTEAPSHMPQLANARSEPAGSPWMRWPLTISARTCMMPLLPMPRALAAPSERSSTRFREAGPRSVITTSTLLLVLISVTRTRAPNGRVRCAAVNACGLNGSPLAVLPP